MIQDTFILLVIIIFLFYPEFAGEQAGQMAEAFKNCCGK